MPLTVTELEAHGLIAAGFEHFSEEERRAAEWARALPSVASIRSVAELADRRVPDAVVAINGTLFTIELKTLVSARPAAVQRNVRRGRGQSRRVLIDGRSAGLDAADALEGLRMALEFYGGDLDGVLIAGAFPDPIWWP